MACSSPRQLSNACADGEKTARVPPDDEGSVNGRGCLVAPLHPEDQSAMIAHAPITLLEAIERTPRTASREIIAPTIARPLGGRQLAWFGRGGAKDGETEAPRDDNETNSYLYSPNSAQSNAVAADVFRRCYVL